MGSGPGGRAGGPYSDPAPAGEGAAGTIPPLLEARHLRKAFPGVLANDDVSLTLHQGEILAILGENGAGKSTLMNMLSGLYHPDSGEILVQGKPVRFGSAADALAAGIGMVHQHFMLVPTLTVAENVVLGAEPGGLFVDRRQAERWVRETSERYGLFVDPRALVGSLSVGMQQRVEIVKALYRNARVLILDEPTSSLTPQETEELFGIMRAMVARGHALIFISHKLREVLAIADRIMVMRQGRVVGETTPAATDESQLAGLMCGRAVSLRVAKAPARPGVAVLEVRGLRVAGEGGTSLLEDISFSVRAGEILGIAGVDGNGQEELVETLMGLRRASAGTVLLNGQPLLGRTPRQVIEAGVAFIPSDRQLHGLVLDFSVADNLVLSSYYREPFARGLWLLLSRILAHARELVRRFAVRTPSVETPVRHLSGGNQQKVVVAREFSRPAAFLLASQPTRGIDVGSIEFVHRELVRRRDEGAAILLVSSELDEVMALADRIAVMYRGRIVGTMPAAEATAEGLGLLMAGAVEGQGAASAC